MIKKITFSVSPETAFQPEKLLEYVRQQLKVAAQEEVNIKLQKRSIDARGREVKVNLEAHIYINEKILQTQEYNFNYKAVTNKPPVLIAGAGPAGLFAALRLMELGLKPVIVERGKDVRSRRRDLAAITKEHIVNPDSNYCFGEGGAGTYSDGKLYTRSTKRGDVKRILHILVNHGAKEDILIDAHPHIGTNKLPKLIEEIRQTILQNGGEIHFDTRITDLIIKNNEIKGIETKSGDKIPAVALILATGHSARDIFELLQKKNIQIEAKPFAMGVRIEHPQSIIDTIQYHKPERGDFLPAAAYSLVCQTQFEMQQRGVFSFCMCPGGFIVPAATAPGEVVVNGMSPSKRDSRFANSGIVVSIEKEDLADFTQFGVLAGLQMQRSLEQKACEYAGGRQTAPAQKLVDFIENKTSAYLNETSYIPGLASVPLQDMLPANISRRLQDAFKMFGQKMKGYVTNEAQIVGVESRTSSPIRIPRYKESCEHPQIKRLFPCGEGAGFAGGIVSAAMDGERCAEQVFLLYAQ